MTRDLFRAGEMVIWSSKTFHQGVQPNRPMWVASGKPALPPRFCTYVSYVPMSWLKTRDVERRKKTIEKHGCSSHNVTCEKQNDELPNHLLSDKKRTTSDYWNERCELLPPPSNLTPVGRQQMYLERVVEEVVDVQEGGNARKRKASSMQS